MPSDERIGVLTPESVEFTFDLSGLASRVLALLVDLFIQGILVVGLIVAAIQFLVPAEGGSFSPGVVMIFIASYLVDWGYFVAFEMLWNGRSPGKKLMGMRVIRDGGLPVNFLSSLIRNFLRPVDYLLSMLMVGFFIMFASPTYKRLGDLAAGTLVVSERRLTLTQLLDSRRIGAFRSMRPPLGLFTKADISAFSPEQFHTMRSFLERRFDLSPVNRRKFALRLFGKVVKLLPSAEGHGIPEEQVLEEIIIAAEGIGPDQLR